MRYVKNLFIVALLFVGAFVPSAAMAQVPAYYYQGQRKVAVEVRTDALSVETSIPLSEAAKAQVAARAAGAAGHANVRAGAGVTAVRSDDMAPGRVLVETKAASLDELNARAQEVRTVVPGAKVRAILQPAGLADDGSTQVLTNEISFQVKGALPAGAINALAQKYHLMDVKPVAAVDGAYTAVATGNSKDLLTPLHTANRMQESGEVEWAAPLVEKKQFKRLVPNDPFFPNQWHLKNDGTNTTEGVSGVDLNVVPAWDFATGAGVNIAIADDGVDTSHTDLLANLRTDIDFDLNDTDDDPMPKPTESHGTACAGVAGAKGNNGVGVAGVAPDAGIVGLRLLSYFETDMVEAQAMSWRRDDAEPVNQVAVNSNSWGPSDTGRILEGPGPLTSAALAAGALQGRNGKGIVYAWAAGNGRAANDNINRDGYANSPFVIAVGATNSAGTFSWYSEPGAPMLVNAPSNHGADGIFTTDISGAAGQNLTDYRNNFGGTSSAAPAVAGVVALMLEANPDLTYRDVMHILVETSVKNDPASASWIVNGSGRLFSHNYGYGRVNAGAAVITAQNWQNVPRAAEPIVVDDVLTTSVEIPDGNATGVVFEMPVAFDGGYFVEHVEVVTDITHSWRGDVRIRLVSPAGTVSELMPANAQDSGDNFSNWPLRSVAHWGESPQGTWKLQVADLGVSDVGKVNGVTLRIRGHERAHTAAEGWELYE